MQLSDNCSVRSLLSEFAQAKYVTAAFNSKWKIRTISRRRSRSPVRRNCSFHVAGTLRKTRRLRQPERHQIKTWWADPWICTIINNLCMFRSSLLLIKNVKWSITRLFGGYERWKESAHSTGARFRIIGRHWLDLQSRPKRVETLEKNHVSPIPPNQEWKISRFSNKKGRITRLSTL